MSLAEHRPAALVFDLDGVLVDSAPSHNRAFEKVFAPCGIRGFSYPAYAGWKTADVIRDVLQGAGQEPAPELVQELAEQKSKLAREELRALNPVISGCIPALEQLSREYPLALASSGSRESVALFLSANRCTHLFRSVLCGNDVNRAKPHPEIYRRSFEALNVEPKEAMVVEDAVSGVQAAVAAGAGFVMGIEGTCAVPDLTEAGANAVIRGVRDLPEFLCDAYDHVHATRN